MMPPFFTIANGFSGSVARPGGTCSTWRQLLGCSLCSTLYMGVQEDEPAFTPLAQLLHSGGVAGADTCLRRPILATASADRSVRIWNYIDRSAPCHGTCPCLFECAARHGLIQGPPRGPCDTVGFERG